MNKESFIYSILASVMGIVIVIVALYIFNLVMVVLQKVFGERRKKGQSAVVSAPAETAAPSQKPSAGEEDPGWIFAAVAAYLADSDEETLPLSALSWQPSPGGAYNPWIHAPNVNQTWTGVR